MGNPANRPYRSRFAAGGDPSQDATRAPARRAPDETESKQPPARQGQGGADQPAGAGPGGPVRRDSGLRRRTDTEFDPRRGRGDGARRTPQSRTELPRTARPAWNPDHVRRPEAGQRAPERGQPRPQPGPERSGIDRPPPRLGREGFLERAGLLNDQDRPVRRRIPGRGPDRGAPSRLRSRSGTLRRALLGAPGRPTRRPPPVSERTARMYRRRRRSALLALLLLCTVVASVGLIKKDPDAPPRAAAPAATLPPAATVPPTTAPAAPPAQLRGTGAPQPMVLDPRAPAGALPPTSAGYPSAGANTFAPANAAGPVLGTGGTLRRFTVSVEKGIGQDPNGFAGAVDRILGDSRSWIASRQLRLQRVPASVAAEFTIYLASPVTSERMCAVGGLKTDRFTSCRLPGKVIINVARWLTAIPDYDAPLVVYQAYAVNHEVGHQLGRGHEACPGPGRPAPLMQQQTYGLKGCVANPWPYLAGARYAGPPVA